MKSIKKSVLLIIVTYFILPNVFYAQKMTNPENQNEELGKVKWYRNYNEATAAAKKEGKNIVLLFQEVPGCSTCRNYGHNVLSNPLIVEALENSFIPLTIFNNKNGEDRKILEKFNEPSWNNPVVRIIDAEGKNIVNRISSDYSAFTLVKRMIEALKISETQIPDYIKILEQELSAASFGNLKEATYQMYCFWSGEKMLGQVTGVQNVESGFIGNSEVVKTQFNNTIISKMELDQYAKKQGYKPVENSNSYNVANSDVHYYLQHSNYKFIPLSETQKTKINSALGSKANVEKFLSPKQITWLNEINKGSLKNRKNLVHENIEMAWKKMK